MVKENQNIYAKIYKYKKAWFYCCEIYIYILSITHMYIIFHKFSFCILIISIFQVSFQKKYLWLGQIFLP